MNDFGKNNSEFCVWGHPWNIWTADHPAPMGEGLNTSFDEINHTDPDLSGNEVELYTNHIQQIISIKHINNGNWTISEQNKI